MVGYMNRTVNEPRFVGLSCFSGGKPAVKDKILEIHQKNPPGVCERFFNSLDIQDR
jgi:hypothetical protein